jgi:hypothetical protein
MAMRRGWSRHRRGRFSASGRHGGSGWCDPATQSSAAVAGSCRRAPRRAQSRGAELEPVGGFRSRGTGGAEHGAQRRRRRCARLRAPGAGVRAGVVRQVDDVGRTEPCPLGQLAGKASTAARRLALHVRQGAEIRRNINNRRRRGLYGVDAEHRASAGECLELFRATAAHQSCLLHQTNTGGNFGRPNSQ